MMNFGGLEMNMTATVIQSGAGRLLVRDSSTGEEVMVFTRDAGDFVPGDRIMITFNGMMTRSIPPQITAISIQRLPDLTLPIEPEEAEMRATILQTKSNSLLVWDMDNNRDVIVSYTYSYHFCVGGQVIVRYDSIRLSNPPEVTAKDIIPICLRR